MFGVRTYDSINKVEIINTMRLEAFPVRSAADSKPRRRSARFASLARRSMRKTSFPRHAHKLRE